MIISGTASQTFAAALARETGRELASVSTERFPDGELSVQLPPSVPDRVVVVGATVSDAAHLELLLLQDAARETGATHVTTIIPYLGYARQERAFEAGQAVSARAMARAIATGTDRVITVDPHEEAVLEFFPFDATAVSAAAQLAPALPENLTAPVFVGPDESARELAATVQRAYGSGSVDHFVKTRADERTVEIAPKETAVADRDVVLVDDMIATGGTMSEAISLLRDAGATRIFATCVHPLLTDTARTRLAQAGVTAVIGTDTIERPESRVSAAPAVAEVM